MGEVEKILADTRYPRTDHWLLYLSFDDSYAYMHQQYGLIGLYMKNYLKCMLITTGKSAVRKSVLTGTDLPSARLISSIVLDSQSHRLNNNTLFTMQWGQFLDHDIALTKVISNGMK